MVRGDETARPDAWTQTTWTGSFALNCLRPCVWRCVCAARLTRPRKSCRRSFRGDCAFRTWFFRIVANVARDRVRAPPGAQELIDDPVDSRATSGPQRVLEQETAQRIAQEVSCLPPRQREVLVLVAYENHSIAEAAAVLGATEQNVRTNLHLARARLRERLARHLSDR